MVVSFVCQDSDHAGQNKGEKGYVMGALEQILNVKSY